MEIYGTKTRTSLQSQYQRNLLHCDISLPINVHLHIISIFYYNVRDSSKRPSRLHQGSRSTDWCHPILSSGKPHRNKATKLNSVGMQIQWMNKTATFDNQMDWSLQVAYSLRRRKFLPCSPKPHPHPQHGTVLRYHAGLTLVSYLRYWQCAHKCNHLIEISTVTTANRSTNRRSWLFSK